MIGARDGPQQHLPAHAEVDDQRSVRSDPGGSESRSNHRYLPRRSVPVIRAPSNWP